MKSIHRNTLALVLAVLAPAVAAQGGQGQETRQSGAAAQDQQREQVRKEVGEAVDALRDYSYERRQEAIAFARRSTAELDRSIEQLQVRSDSGWSRMTSAARSRSRSSMDDLRKRRAELAEWTGGLRHGSAAAWEEVKGGFVRSYRELAQSVRKARAQMDREEQAAGSADKEADAKQDAKADKPGDAERRRGQD